METPNRKVVALGVRWKVIGFHEQGFSLREIAGFVNLSKSVVQRIIKRFEETSSVTDRHRSGRPHITTPRDEHNLVNLCKKNRQNPSHVLAAKWSLASGQTASPSTVRRKLVANKLEWKLAVKKP